MVGVFAALPAMRLLDDSSDRGLLDDRDGERRDESGKTHIAMLDEGEAVPA